MTVMSPEELALYPFLTKASEYVSELDFSLDALMTGLGFKEARRRGNERVLEAFSGEITKPVFGNEKDTLSELLSYPFARILVSCLNEPAFTRRYALAEATAAHSLLRKTMDKDIGFVLDFGKDFGIIAFEQSDHIRIYFSDYIRYSLSMKDLSWKLINRHIEKGYVIIRREEFVRLLQEAIRKRIESSLPVQEIPKEIRAACESQVAELKTRYEEQRQNLGDADLGEVDFTMFPPCINKALSNV
ncbi:MAG: DNA primase regulatory subunit PriL, partial [Methanimicrococcus sp.]|nr:DNA primase regulatory subunit PriL [Methanimicrococcus sp.]